MVLSLRTLATVSIYFLDEQSRKQLLDFGTLRAKIWARLTGKGKSRTRFQRSGKLEAVRMIEPNGACESTLPNAIIMARTPACDVACVPVDSGLTLSCPLTSLLLPPSSFLWVVSSVVWRPKTDDHTPATTDSSGTDGLQSPYALMEDEPTTA